MSSPVKTCIVADTGALISLEKLAAGYEFIRKLYDTIFIPPAVLLEVSEGCLDTQANYFDHFDITDLISIKQPPQKAIFIGKNELDKGEIEAIALALEMNLPLLIEERKGREVAKSLGIERSGIAGQIVKAYDNFVIEKSEAINLLTELHQKKRLNKRVYDAIIESL